MWEDANDESDSKNSKTDLFLFCYERDFMTSLSDVKKAEIIEAFKSNLDIWGGFHERF